MKSLSQYILEAEEDTEGASAAGNEGEEKTTQRGKIKFVIWEEPDKKVSWLDNNEKYQKIDLTDSDVIPAKARRGEKSEKEESKEKDAIFFENIRKAQKPKVEENEEDEVSFFGEIKKITSKRQTKIEDEDIQDTKVGVFGKIKKMGNKKKKSSDEDVW